MSKTHQKLITYLFDGSSYTAVGQKTILMHQEKERRLTKTEAKEKKSEEYGESLQTS